MLKANFCQKNTISTDSFYVKKIDMDVQVYNSVKDFESIWKPLENQFPVFLRSTYFYALEQAQVSGLKCKYLLLYEQQKLIGLVPIQTKHFKGNESILDLDQSKANIRSTVAKYVQFDTCVAGNISVSGPYMYAFLQEPTKKRSSEILQSVFNAFKSWSLKKEGVKYSLEMIKDIFVDTDMDEALNKFTMFEVEPIMFFKVNPSWTSMDDCVAMYTSKYRVRYRRARKKFTNYSVKELDIQELQSLKAPMYELYKNVLGNINFTLFELPESYFYNMKAILKDTFHVMGIFDTQNQLVGFYSLIENEKELHAHYLGYDKLNNQEGQIYLNMLYDMVAYGIDNGFDVIDMGRTALEIKSSVGAIPEEMHIAVKHSNTIANAFLPKVIRILNKKTDWIPRHPFKQSEKV